MKRISELGNEDLLNELARNVNSPKRVVLVILTEIFTRTLRHSGPADSDVATADKLIELTKMAIAEDPDLSHQPMRLRKLGAECSAIRKKLLARMGSKTRTVRTTKL